MAVCGFNDDEFINANDDCVDYVRGSKTVKVRCTSNKMQPYTVKVPRQVTEQRPRTVQYTDFVNRTKTVPYTVNRSVRRTRTDTQTYQVPVPITKTRMVPVTKKVPKTVMVPKTVYVNVTSQVPQQHTTTKLETRTRQIPVPYYVNVPETRYNTVTEQVPVQRTKVQMDTVTKTVYDTQVRQRCVPKSTICSKTIPVFNVRSKPPSQCPAECRNEGYGTGDSDMFYGDGNLVGIGQVTEDHGVISSDAASRTDLTGTSFSPNNALLETELKGNKFGNCASGGCAVVDPESMNDFMTMNNAGYGVTSHNGGRVNQY